MPSQYTTKQGKPSVLVLSCPECEKTFERARSTVKNPVIYCSHKCRWAVQRRTWDSRFWEKVDKSGECWVWTAAKNSAGYGLFGDSKKHLVHRISYEIHFGEIPAGLHVCHRCDNPPCLRPEHLFAGTDHDNHMDAMLKGRLKGRVDRRGTGGKLTDDQIREIRRVYQEGGVTGRSLAFCYGISPSSLSKIVRGETYTNLFPP